MSRPIPTSEATDLDFLESELKEWTAIQEMVNESYEKEEDQIINHSWSSDIPYLHLYHTLVDDTIRSAFGKASCLIQFPPEMVENWWRYGGELVTK